MHRRQHKRWVTNGLARQEYDVPRTSVKHRERARRTSSTTSSPASTPVPRSAPPHICDLSPRRTSQTRSACQSSLSFTRRPTPSRGSRMSDSPSNLSLLPPTRSCCARGARLGTSPRKRHPHGQGRAGVYAACRNEERGCRRRARVGKRIWGGRQ